MSRLSVYLPLHGCLSCGHQLFPDFLPGGYRLFPDFLPPGHRLMSGFLSPGHRLMSGFLPHGPRPLHGCRSHAPRPPHGFRPHGHRRLHGFHSHGHPQVPVLLIPDPQPMYGPRPSGPQLPRKFRPSVHQLPRRSQPSGGPAQDFPPWVRLPLYGLLTYGSPLRNGFPSSGFPLLHGFPPPGSRMLRGFLPPCFPPLRGSLLPGLYMLPVHPCPGQPVPACPRLLQGGLYCRLRLRLWNVWEKLYLNQPQCQRCPGAVCCGFSVFHLPVQIHFLNHDSFVHPHSLMQHQGVSHGHARLHRSILNVYGMHINMHFY